MLLKLFFGGAVVLGSLAPPLLAYSHGASRTSCEEMIPRHIHAHRLDPPHSYVSMQTSAPFYLPGKLITVTIRSSRDFMGFLLQARSVDGDRSRHRRGAGIRSAKLGPLVRGASWILSPPGTHTLSCHSDRDTVTQSDKQLKRNLSFVWRAPDVPTGDIRFHISIVQSYFVYWATVDSPVVRDVTRRVWGTTKAQIMDGESTVFDVALNPAIKDKASNKQNSRTTTTTSSEKSANSVTTPTPALLRIITEVVYTTTEGNSDVIGSNHVLGPRKSVTEEPPGRPTNTTSRRFLTLPQNTSSNRVNPSISPNSKFKHLVSFIPRQDLGAEWKSSSIKPKEDTLSPISGRQDKTLTLQPSPITLFIGPLSAATNHSPRGISYEQTTSTNLGILTRSDESVLTVFPISKLTSSSVESFTTKLDFFPEHSLQRAFSRTMRPPLTQANSQSLKSVKQPGTSPSRPPKTLQQTRTAQVTASPHSLTSVDRVRAEMTTTQSPARFESDTPSESSRIPAQLMLTTARMSSQSFNTPKSVSHLIFSSTNNRIKHTPPVFVPSTPLLPFASNPGHFGSSSFSGSLQMTTGLEPSDSPSFYRSFVSEHPSSSRNPLSQNPSRTAPGLFLPSPTPISTPPHLPFQTSSLRTTGHFLPLAHPTNSTRCFACPPVSTPVSTVSRIHSPSSSTTAPSSFVSHRSATTKPSFKVDTPPATFPITPPLPPSILSTPRLLNQNRLTSSDPSSPVPGTVVHPNPKPFPNLRQNQGPDVEPKVQNTDTKHKRPHNPPPESPEKEGKYPDIVPRHGSWELVMLLVCSAGLGMALVVGVRQVYRQACDRRTGLTLNDRGGEGGLIQVQECRDLVRVRKIRDNSFVLLAGYDILTPPAN